MPSSRPRSGRCAPDPSGFGRRLRPPDGLDSSRNSPEEREHAASGLGQQQPRASNGFGPRQRIRASNGFGLRQRIRASNGFGPRQRIRASNGFGPRQRTVSAPASASEGTGSSQWLRPRGEGTTPGLAGQSRREGRVAKAGGQRPQ